ncbi:MAG: ATP-binding protein [Bacteroidales bacterium]|nr:ATP-binding protein [Bacteroidales bacterium]
MRFIAFRIRNFRSIVDTGWQNISPDNITCLIGQNESGKTSVLEGLRVFHTGEISEDVLRSDLSLPEVSCKFEVDGEALLAKIERADNELGELIKNRENLIVVRSWKADLSSGLSVGGNILTHLDDIEGARREHLEEIEKKVLSIDNDLVAAREKVKSVGNEIEEIVTKLGEEPKKGQGIRFFKKKEIGASKSDDNKWKKLRDNLKSKKNILEENSRYLNEREDLLDSIEEWDRLKLKLGELDDELKEISSRLEERHQTMTLLSGPSLRDLSLGEWEGVLSDYKLVTREREEIIDKIDRQTLLLGFVLDGMSSEVAAEKSAARMKNDKSGYTPGMLGDIFFEDCPVFEIFEDFGSLLPNRIDLEDIISAKEEVEGYKAARNFLTIANLDYSFFQQPSTRILKQKIENLNARLTLDFQDFWQQYVGKKNKIRINFELDHYSISHGDKAGKPYLEFWVKDEGERLYPKQRSRGVRWFLSFYMELMAASGKDKHLVLLVDEPGVSLHARAQEDVLKVFEDIKNNIQVIYTTHSPHLVDIDKLHRVLAIQRDDVENHRSATTILDATHLVDASPDTLSPLQSIMGNPVGTQEFSVDLFNIIVNDVGTFYLMTAAMKLTGYKGVIHFIPSTEPSAIPLMCNILMGWGMKFAVLLFNNDEELEIAGHLKNLAFTDELVQEDMIVVMPEGFQNAEDLLSTLDFKRHVLHSREGITFSNSEYIREKDLPRNFLLSKFLSNVKTGSLKRENLDEETRENLVLLLNILQKYK